MPLFKPQAYKIIQLIPVWAQAYQVDEQAIIKQIPIAYAWCVANKEKAPKKNYARFLNVWMGNAKKFGNLVVSQNKPLYKENLPPPEELLTFEDIQAMKNNA